MASFAFTDPVIYLHGYDLTSDVHNLTLEVEAEELDTTTFGSSGHRSRIGGLKSTHFASEGYWQYTPDAEQFPNLGTANRVLTVAPTNTEGQVAYIAQVGQFQYSLGGQVGEVMPFTLDAMNTDPQGLVRGMLGKKKGNVSATGALGTGLNLGAVGASSYLYATLHTFSVGTTITVIVESDDNSGFTTPTTRATIGPVTTVTGTWATRVAGSITDTWWRFNVSAITGTFSVAGAICIG